MLFDMDVHIHLRVLSISDEKEPTHRCLHCDVGVFLHVSLVISSAPQSYRLEVHRFVTLAWNLRVREVSKPGGTLSRGLKLHLLLSVIVECNEWTSDETTTLKYQLKDFTTITLIEGRPSWAKK